MINEINKTEQTITSMQVAEMVGKEHNNVLKDIRKIIEHLGAVKSYQAYFSKSCYRDAQGKDRPCYQLTKKGCELFSTRMTGAKGTQFAVAYIELFNKMETHIKSTFKLPTTMAEALRLAADQAEQLEQQAPMVLFAKSVSASPTSILVGDLAKILMQNGVEIGGTRLFEWLRSNGYLIKRRGDSWNMPTQRSMDLGLFEIKESTHMNSNGKPKITKTPKVTGKGQEYFVNKLIKDDDERYENLVARLGL